MNGERLIKLSDLPTEDIVRFRFPQDEHLDPILGDVIPFRNASFSKPFYFANAGNKPCFKLANPYYRRGEPRRQLNAVVVNTEGRSTVIQILPDDWVREAVMP